jgi:hypothetical protein
MTLLSICNDAYEEAIGQEITAIAASSSADAIRLFALAKRELQTLSRVHPWQALVAETTFLTTVAAAQAGALPADFDYILEGTVWDRTNIRELNGPVEAAQWQRLQATQAAASALDRQFRIRGDSFLLYPAPTVATDTIAFEYAINTPCETAGGTAQTTWVADTDVGKISEVLLTLGVKWRLRRALGLAHDDDLNEYLSEVEKAMARDGGAKVLSTAQRNYLIIGANTAEQGYG